MVFLNTEFLSNPTMETITVSLIPAEDADLFVEYGPPREDFPRRTPVRTVSSGTLATFTLDGLEPSRDYHYRVRGRRPGAGPFGTREVRRFRTLRRPGTTFRFGFVTDSHIFQAYARASQGGRYTIRPGSVFDQTMGNIRNDDLDFLILGGDETMIVCHYCPPCEVDGEYAGWNTARQRGQALLRYRVFRRAFEQVAHSLPVFLTLGNHDGEAGFGDPQRSCYHYDTTQRLSRLARLRHLPNPADVYDGAPEGNYYSFESGDALFVVLDVMRYTMDYPKQPEDWTLGAIQLDWLESTLAGSSRPWKLVIAHHLVGGSGSGNCYAYARGSVKTTDTGMARGTFRGEQARVHELMRQHGAQFFLMGHDHVFHAAEKLDRQGQGEGIYYVVGGHAAGLHPPPWSTHPDFVESYDLDGDGSADYLLDKGYLRVTVDGARAVRLEYVRSDAVDPAENGKVVYDRWIYRRTAEEEQGKGY